MPTINKILFCFNFVTLNRKTRFFKSFCNIFHPYITAVEQISTRKKKEKLQNHQIKLLEKETRKQSFYQNCLALVILFEHFIVLIKFS